MLRAMWTSFYILNDGAAVKKKKEEKKEAQSAEK